MKESTRTEFNCGTQYPTNVSHDSAESWETTMHAL